MTKTVELTFYADVGGYYGIGAAEFRNTMRSLVDETVDVVIIRMITYGGYVHEGNGIIDTINEYRQKYGTLFIGINDAYVASMGTTIMLAMDKIWGTPKSLFHTHRSWTEVAGNSDDLKKVAEELEKSTEPTVEALMTKTGRNREEVLELMDSERFIDVDEAIEFGLADKVYTGESTEAQDEAAKEYLQLVLDKPETASQKRLVEQLKSKFGE